MLKCLVFSASNYFISFMKRSILFILLLLSSCGGSSGEGGSFKAGYYGGETRNTNNDYLCKSVSVFVNYYLHITDVGSAQNESELQIEKIFVTSHGVFPAGVPPITVSGDESEVSYSDVDENQEFPYSTFLGDGTEISCFVKKSVVNLKATEQNVKFEANSELDCTASVMPEGFKCSIKEQGELLPWADQNPVNRSF